MHVVSYSRCCATNPRWNSSRASCAKSNRARRAEPRPEPQEASRSLWSRLRLPAAGLVTIATVATIVVAQRSAPVPAQQTAKLNGAPLNGDELALGTRLPAGTQP